MNNRLRRLSAWIALFAFVFSGICIPALANPAPTAPSSTHTLTFTTPHSTTASRPPLNLNLSSIAASLSAPHFVQNTPININVGGAALAVTRSTMLTPAERLAVFQVLHSGQQSLLLGSQGNAVGGSFTIGQNLAQHLSSLLVPQGVTAIAKFATSSPLNLSGNLTNAGTLYAVSAVPNLTATISAANIINQQGGLITSVLPAGGLAGFTSLTSSLHLTLASVNNIVNSGIISSSGNLSLNAGGSIINAPGNAAGLAIPGSAGILPASANQTPLIQALNNVNLNAATITNSGLISSATGNINIASQVAQSIAVNNAGGSLQALAGNININSPSTAGAGNVSLMGGDFLSKQLNVFAGTGAVTAQVNDISGTVNISGGSAHVTTDSGRLTLGNLSLTGDPTFYNTDATAGITISGNISTGEALSIVSAGNITSSGNFTIATTATGADINLVAGANITSTGGTVSSSVAGSGTSTGWTGTGTPAGPIVISSTPASGGNIDFHNNTMSISTPGGTVRLIAFADSTGSTGGQVLLSSASSITTTGSGNGNVIIIAGRGVSGTAVSTGLITTTGTSSGNVSVSNAQPAFTSGTSLTFNTEGTIAGGNDFQPSSSGSADILVNGAVQAGGSVSLTAGSNVQVNNTVTANGSTGSGSVTVSGGNSGTITVASGILVSSVNDVITINVPSGGTFTNNGTVQSSASGPGATITVQNPSGPFTLSGTGTFRQTGSAPGLTLFSTTDTNTGITLSNGTSLTIDNGVGGTAATPLSIISPVVTVDPAPPPPPGSTGVATLTTSNSGAITVQPTAAGTGSLTFQPSPTDTSATLNLNGGAVTSTSTGLKIASGMAVASDNSITLNVNGGSPASPSLFINNGAVSSGGDITIGDTTSGDAIALAGGTPGVPGVFTVTNGGTTTFQASTIAIANGTVQQIIGGGTVQFHAQNVVFLGNNSSITATSASQVNFDSGTSGGDLTFSAPSSTTNTIASTGGMISIQPTNAADSVFFNNSDSVPTSNAVFAFNGGAFEITTSATGGKVAISSSATVTSNCTITATTQELDLGSGAVLSSTGWWPGVNITAPDGATGLTIQSPNNSSATISVTSGTITISVGSEQSLSFTNSGSSPTTLNLNGGLVLISTGSSSSNVTVSANTTVSSDTGFNITTPEFDNFGTVQAVGATSSIVLSGVSGADLVITGTGGIWTAGSVININVDAGNQLHFSGTGDQTFTSQQLTIDRLADLTSGSIGILVDGSYTVSASADNAYIRNVSSINDAGTLQNTTGPLIVFGADGSDLSITGGGIIAAPSNSFVALHAAVGNAVHFISSSSITINSALSIDRTIPTAGVVNITIDPGFVLTNNGTANFTNIGTFNNQGTFNYFAAGVTGQSSFGTGDLTISGGGNFGTSGGTFILISVAAGHTIIFPHSASPVTETFGSGVSLGLTSFATGTNNVSIDSSQTILLTGSTVIDVVMNRVASVVNMGLIENDTGGAISMHGAPGTDLSYTGGGTLSAKAINFSVDSGHTLTFSQSTLPASVETFLGTTTFGRLPDTTGSITVMINAGESIAVHDNCCQSAPGDLAMSNVATLNNSGSIVLDGILNVTPVRGQTLTITGSGRYSGFAVVLGATGFDTPTLLANTVTFTGSPTVDSPNLGVFTQAGGTVNVSSTSTITGPQGVFIDTSNLVNQGTIIGNTSQGVFVSDQFSGQGINISGGGTMQSNRVVELSAGNGDLRFSGNQNFAAGRHVYLDGYDPGQVIINSGVTLTSMTGFEITTNHLVNNGTLLANGLIPFTGGQAMLITDDIPATAMTVSGSGSFVAAAGAIVFINSNNPIQFSGNLSLTALATSTAPGVGILDFGNNGVDFLPGSTFNVTAGNGQIVVASSSDLNISGQGSIGAQPELVLTAGSGNLNFTGNITFSSSAVLSAVNGTVNISGTVNHSSSIIYNAPGSIPSGFTPTTGITQPNPLITPPGGEGAAIGIITDPLVVDGVVAGVQAPVPPAPSPGLPPPKQTGGNTVFRHDNNNNNTTTEQNQVQQISTRIATDTTPATVYGWTLGSTTGIPENAGGPNNSSISGTETNSSNFNQQTVDGFHQGGIHTGTGTGGHFFNLDVGNMVFNPTTNITVGTHEGNVHIDGGCIAFVMETGNDVAVYDLHDTRSGGVRVQAGNKTITLHPGQQVVLTRQPKADFAKINPGGKIAYRNERSEDVGNGIKAFIADFSMPTALTTVAPLKQLLTSTSRADRRLAHQLLKNAVVLNETSSANGPYRSSQ